MAKITPITKEKLKELGFKFITVKVPVFPISINKTALMKVHLFDTIEEATDFLKEIGTLIIFDTEAFYGSEPIESLNANKDSLYLRIADINENDWKHIESNMKDPKDVIHHFDFDMSYFN